MPTPLCVSGDTQAQKGSPWSTHLSIHAPGRPAKRTALGLFWEARRESQQLQEAILSTVGHTGQTHSRLWEKSSLQNPSISRQESQESLIPDT